MSTMKGEESGARPTPRSGRRWKRWLAWGAVGSVVLFGLIQLIPFGHRNNPPVAKAAVWPNTRAETLAANGCNDCHSNLTKRWWATEIAPASWLAQSDVNGGRNALNFSEWDKPQADLDNVIEAVQSGSMPPLQYKLFHGNARLGDAERTQLADGLRQLYATDPPAGTKQGGG
ncbi:MAG: heme-binding domain-containing protein [Thermoleophilia bacterium]|nr:heme-binding domain-containing protein [Thermoleophilia bacterium]